MRNNSQMLLMSSSEKLEVILKQIVEMISNLQTKEEPGHIDLQQLPLSSDEIDELDDLLGSGSVKAEVEHLGYTQIYSTAVPSLWRVIHFNDEGEVLSDFLEVSYCPEIMITTEEDIPVGKEYLQARLFELSVARKNKKMM